MSVKFKKLLFFNKQLNTQETAEMTITESHQNHIHDTCLSGIWSKKISHRPRFVAWELISFSCSELAKVKPN